MTRDGTSIARDAGLVAMRLMALYPSLKVQETTAAAFAAMQNDPSLSVDEVVQAFAAAVEAR